MNVAYIKKKHYLCGLLLQIKKIKLKYYGQYHSQQSRL